MSSVLAGMEDVASRENYNLIITQSLEKRKKKRMLILYNKRVDGLLISWLMTRKTRTFTAVFSKGIPVVFLTEHSIIAKAQAY
jgi:DNA-binding LacI/PurR family transcriptional regulator